MLRGRLQDNVRIPRQERLDIHLVIIFWQTIHPGPEMTDHSWQTIVAKPELAYQSWQNSGGKTEVANQCSNAHDRAGNSKGATRH